MSHKYQRMIVQTAAVVGFAATMAMPVAAHGLDLDFRSNVNAEMRQEGVWGKVRGKFNKERAADRRELKRQKQEEKEARREAREAKESRDLLAKADPACMRTAIEKRENAMLSAVDGLSVAVRNAVIVRKAALTAAWNASLSVDAREAAITAAWEAYSTSVKNANKAFHEKKDAAWVTFRTEAEKCLPAQQ